MMADKMPLMLDNAVPVDLNDVDDLFGDAVGLSMPERSQNKNLLQRMDDLRGRGCCQAIAWSKTGTIASITPDGQSLELRFLRCNPRNGSWDLSEPTTCNLVSGSPGIPLVHLKWGPTNMPELAVVDAVGRIAIISFPISLNSPFITKKWDADAIDDANAVVGTHWLAVAPSNQQRPFNVIYGPATRNGNQYQYETSFIHASGPHHPHLSKSALFCVTVNGMLKMFWSQNNNRLEETAIEMESVISSDEFITHAALASDKKSLLVALATSSRQLRLIKVDIQWSGPGEKNPPPQNSRLSPSLVEKHLVVTTWLQTVPGDPSNDASMAELSSVHILSSLVDGTGKTMALPCVLTVRSRAQNAGSYQMAQTIIDRWEIVSDQRQDLHPAFEQLGARKSGDPPEQSSCTRLKKLEPIIINRVVIGIHAVSFGTVLALSMADGAVEYRDRYTFAEIYHNEGPNHVTNLRQFGWTFSEEGPCQQVAFSPTHCSMIQMSDDGTMRWSKLQYPHGDIGDSSHDVPYGATLASLTIIAATAIYSQSNYDDVLAIAQPYKSKKRFIPDWITEIIRILKIQVDYSEDLQHDALMRNALLQNCLSIMNSLGFYGELKPRSFQSKLAMIELNVRNVVILITLSSNLSPSVSNKMSPLDEHEVVDALAGCAKWSVDLMSWLIDSLFELMNDTTFLEKLAPQRMAEVTPYLHERNNVALHLLLSSCSRGFLLVLCRKILYLESLSTRAITYCQRQSASGDQSKGPNPQLQQAYQRMQSIITSSLVKVSELEKLLNALGADIKTIYTQALPALAKAGSNAAAPPPQGAVRMRQVQLEMALFMAASPPQLFLPVMKKLLGNYLPGFRKMLDPARLFFEDYSLLGVQDDKSSLAAREAKGVYVDLFKKAVLKMGSQQQWRRCARCASVMEDMLGTRPGFNFVLGQQRKCSCGGQWAVLPKGKLVL